MSTQEEAALEAEAKRRGISVVQLKTRMALTNPMTGRDLMGEWQNEADEQRELRWAAKKREWAKPTEEPKPRGSGWAEPRPLGPQPGAATIDHMLDVAEARDRRALAQELGVEEPSYVTRMLGPVRGAPVVQERSVSKPPEPTRPAGKMRRI
jgi:hypothetical protein